MIPRYIALAVLLVPNVTSAQEAKDLFACIEPSRLAPRTATYSVSGTSVKFSDIEIVDTLTNAGQRLLRITRQRLRDKTITAEQIMQVDARTLAPVSYLHRAPSRPEPLADLAVQLFTSDTIARLTGKTYGGHVVFVPTNGAAVLFGTSAAAMLLAAVDWDRCESVTALQLSSEDLQLRRTMSIKKVGKSVFKLKGKNIPVYELQVTSETFKWSMFVTSSAPFVVTKFVSTLGSTTELISIRK